MATSNGGTVSFGDVPNCEVTFRFWDQDGNEQIVGPWELQIERHESGNYGHKIRDGESRAIGVVFSEENDNGPIMGFRWWINVVTAIKGSGRANKRAQNKATATATATPISKTVSPQEFADMLKRGRR